MFRKNLAIQILLGLIFVLAALSGIVCVIGYYEFTGAIEAQYAESAYNTACTALTYITPGFCDEENYSSREWLARIALANREWVRLADTQHVKATRMLRFFSTLHHQNLLLTMSAINSFRLMKFI